ALDREEESEGDAEEDDQAHERAAREEREAGLHADPRAEDRGHHREREQPVGVAQHPVAAGRLQCTAVAAARDAGAELVLFESHACLLHERNGSESGSEPEGGRPLRRDLRARSSGIKALRPRITIMGRWPHAKLTGSLRARAALTMRHTS